MIMDFIKKIPKYVWVVSIIFLTLFIAINILAQKETEDIKDSRYNIVCFFGMNRIMVALLEYSEMEGNNLYFPSDLKVLLEKGYLKDENILYCQDDKKPYHYIAGLRKDMPSDCPIFWESSIPHTYNYKGSVIKYGRVMRLDSTISFIKDDDYKDFAKSIEVLEQVLKSEDLNFLRKVENSREYKSFTKDMAKWKISRIK